MLVGLFRDNLNEERLRAAASKDLDMHFDSFSFGYIQIDGTVYEHDIVIDRCEVRKRKKKPSKKNFASSSATRLSR
jgi:hypothetical protein